MPTYITLAVVAVLFGAWGVQEFLDRRALRAVIRRRLSEGTAPAATVAAPSHRTAHDGGTAEGQTTPTGAGPGGN